MLVLLVILFTVKLYARINIFKPNICFVINYFVKGLLAWKASIDIQPAFNHCKAITYICGCYICFKSRGRDNRSNETSRERTISK